MSLIEYAEGVIYNKRDDVFLVDCDVIDGVDDVGELEITGDTIEAMSLFRHNLNNNKEKHDFNA
jgi:hypothetical protein